MPVYALTARPIYGSMNYTAVFTEVSYLYHSQFIVVSRNAQFYAEGAAKSVWWLLPKPTGELTALPDTVAEFRRRDPWGWGGKREGRVKGLGIGKGKEQKG